jgi:hypothetical protein
MVYDELNLPKIAWKLHCSSAAHLSDQFKKLTGHTPVHLILRTSDATLWGTCE